MTHTEYDTHGTRFTCWKTVCGAEQDWLFLPGGPGADGQCFEALIALLDMPGRYWSIDLPNNGNNDRFDLETYDYAQWMNCFVPAVQRFKSPILVGHSFGAMLPLLFPALEDCLKGFVILNSAPGPWRELANKRMVEKGIPPYGPEMDAFTQNPNEETFRAAFLACAPCYFAPKALAAGRAMILKLPFNYRAAPWWMGLVEAGEYVPKWIPQGVPTSILCGDADLMTCPELYLDDARFQKPHIQMTLIPDAGHFPWIDQPAAVQAFFQAFWARLG